MSSARPYIPLPRPLLVDLNDAPLAIGAYALIARRFAISREAVPLSAADLTRYDPSLSYGQAVRCLARLVSRGWLLETGKPGCKSRYTPSWGLIRGTPRTWSMEKEKLGRPPHVQVCCLTADLLDTYMGQLTPHPRGAALISRYVEQPLLSLTDVGAYALLLGLVGDGSPALAEWGLVSRGRAIEVPDRATILALASQRGMATNDIVLSTRGLDLFGVTVDNSTAEGQPLFFVPKQQIGTVIDGLIDHPISNEPITEAPPTASDSRESHFAPDAKTSHAKNPNPNKRSNTTAAAGRSCSVELPETPAARKLWALGVRPEVVAELATIDERAIDDAIADAEHREDLRDKAGWVVSMLRMHRDYGWRIPAAPEPYDHGAALAASFRRMEEENQRIVDRILGGMQSSA